MQIARHRWPHTHPAADHAHPHSLPSRNALFSQLIMSLPVLLSIHRCHPTGRGVRGLRSRWRTRGRHGGRHRRVRHHSDGCGSHPPRPQATGAWGVTGLLLEYCRLHLSGVGLPRLLGGRCATHGLHVLRRRRLFGDIQLLLLHPIEAQLLSVLRHTLATERPCMVGGKRQAMAGSTMPRRQRLGAASAPDVDEPRHTPTGTAW